MYVVILKAIFMVWVLLVVMDAVLVVWEEVEQVLVPLAAKCSRNSKENVFFIVAKMAAELMIISNIRIFLACKVCRDLPLFWLLQPH